MKSLFFVLILCTLPLNATAQDTSQLDEFPRLSAVGDFSFMSANYKFFSIKDGWINKGFSEASQDTMLLIYTSQKNLLGFGRFLTDVEAQTALLCNFVDCELEGNTVQYVGPVPYRTDMLWVSTQGNPAIKLHRSRWDELVR